MEISDNQESHDFRKLFFFFNNLLFSILVRIIVQQKKKNVKIRIETRNFNLLVKAFTEMNSREFTIIKHK